MLSKGRKPEIDSINVLLEECIMAFPVSSFIISLYKQYQQRGSLSKKQLQGLYDKASGIQDLAPGKLAAVEAIIKRMPTRFKSALPENKPLYEKDEGTGEMIDFILSKNPNHKRVIFLKAKYENNEVLTPTELSELKKFVEVFKK
ncbi:MAG: hypothetical protein JNK79_07215 [Chitinophagaceae bacterium]|nr:hypothetical protein [Chitinophagaceae bacterium]